MRDSVNATKAWNITNKYNVFSLILLRKYILLLQPELKTLRRQKYSSLAMQTPPIFKQCYKETYFNVDITNLLYTHGCGIYGNIYGNAF